MTEKMNFGNIVRKALNQKGFVGGDEEDKVIVSKELEEVEEYEPDYVEVFEAWKDYLVVHGFDAEDLTPLEVIESAKERIGNYRIDLAKKRQEVNSMSLEEQGKAYEEISDKIKRENKLIEIAENFLMINGKYFK